ncbi:hypothetical protein [Stutzerimonas frequens]|uniref:hypothetical protein n=1 Tax=Stutzerimonas frequens TaxID=2968969 RepID=UPI001AAF4BFC|nr:hypothetical protein [Stutzerimonas frequens]QTF59104.1 hypothetical protein J4H94_21050 [Stutzerimonas frequens]
MATEIRPELAARIAEMDAITDRYRDLDSHDEPSIYARKQTMSQVYGDFDRIAEGVADERNIRYLADDHVRLLEQWPGKPEQQELAYYIGNAMSSNGQYKQAVEQRAAALASSFGWALPGEQFQLTIDAAAFIHERNMLAKEDRKAAEIMATLSTQARNLETQASTLSAEIQQMRMAGSSHEQIQERETELAGLQAERAKTLLQVLPQMRDEEFKAGASPERLEQLDSAIQEAKATLTKGSQPERIVQTPAPELSAEEREQINQARADFGMEPMEDPAQPIRFQQQPEPQSAWANLEDLKAEVSDAFKELLRDSQPADQDPELLALASQIEKGAGLAGIRERAEAFNGSVSLLGLAAARQSITLDVARDWVAADVRDFGGIDEPSQINEAATVMLINAGKVGLYGQELKSSELALSAELKKLAAPLDQVSSIAQRYQAQGKPSSAGGAKIRANEDALEIVLGCDVSDQGLAVVSRNMNNKDYRESFKETVAEFIALNEDGPFYDAERFWAAQRIIQISERKEYLRQGGEPELSDWSILLAEVLQKQRRPLSGAEFKELVIALEGAARDANTQKAEIHQVVGLLAKVHGPSGESLFRDHELRGAYRDGLREQSRAEAQLFTAPTADVTHDVKKRSTPAMRA